MSEDTYNYHFESYGEAAAYHHGYDHGYQAGKKRGIEKAGQEDIPVFYTVRDPWMPRDVILIRCEWKGVTSQHAVATWHSKYARDPEHMLLEIARRLMWTCFQGWARQRGYLD